MSSVGSGAWASSSSSSLESTNETSDSSSGPEPYESWTSSYEYGIIDSSEKFTEDSITVSVDDRSFGSNLSDIEQSSCNRFNTVDVQTDIAGIDSLIAYGQPIEDCVEIVTGLPTIQQFSCAYVFTEATDHENENTRPMCCKCQDDDSKETLSKCRKAGMETLLSQCEQLGLADMLERIQTQWERGKLRIHQSCRQDLHNKIILQTRKKGLHSIIYLSFF